MTDTPARQLGPWVLGAQLGSGGNAKVWSATRAGDPPVALKVIHAQKVKSEPYKRFVQEITFLRNHHSIPGILPLVDAHLPQEPTRDDPPWLAMPIAQPISEALAGCTLVEVVAAVAAIAETLWRLQRDFDVAHRDIKPGNLYHLDGAWLIGDFGLVALPDTKGLTAAGRPLGPAHYTPYEMILDPSKAQPHPADVYSLGKTLWVLATDQRFPPEGHQPAGTRGFQIGDFRPYPKADSLDREVDIATRLHPEERPSKEQFARDLSLWCKASQDPPAIDVTQSALRLREKLQVELQHQDIQEQRKKLADAAIRRLQELIKPLNDSLRALWPKTQFDLSMDEMTKNILKSDSPQDVDVVFRWQRCTFVAPLDGPTWVTLRMSRCVELSRQGDLIFHAMVYAGPEGVGGPNFHWHETIGSAPVGTIEAEKLLEAGTKQLRDALASGIEYLVAHLPDGVS